MTKTRYDTVFLDVDGTLPRILVDRSGGVEAPEAVAVMPDLSGLPAWLEGWGYV